MNEFYPRKEVLPGLWVGSAKDARDQQFLRNVGLVVNCSKNIPFYTAHIPGYRVAVDDNFEETTLMIKYLERVTKIIDEALQNNTVVLVHCYAGMQRSSAVAASYLMYKLFLGPDEAMKAIKKAKPESFLPSPTFTHALHRYWSSLRKASSSI
jgi:dual specificity phosphatase 12